MSTPHDLAAPSESEQWRDLIFAGPGSNLASPPSANCALDVLATPDQVAAALAAAGHTDSRSMPCNGAVTTALILGQCLFTHENSASVIERIWAQLGPFHPRTVIDGPVTEQALSDARARVPAKVVKKVFQANTRRPEDLPDLPGLRRFGLVLTAVDSTVLDLWRSDTNTRRFGIPSGGRRPQLRLLTVVACGTRHVLAAACDAHTISEQALFDQVIDQLRPGTLTLADRGFFSMDRWIRASATGAELLWRIKNDNQSLPATLIEILPDGSARVLLHESDAMLGRRRTKIGDPTVPRLPDTVARLVEFHVITRDRTGRKTRSERFRVLTTLLDPTAYPAEAIADCYAERWAIELSYKTIKSSVRGRGRPLRGQSPELVEQEVWGLLTVYNVLVDQAVAAATDLGIDPDEISLTTVLRLTRDHLIRHAPCTACGHVPDQADLVAEIAAAPRNRIDRHRAGPRTKKDRETQRTRDVDYVVEITRPDLSKADESPARSGRDHTAKTS
jgi:hypothetical protein